MKIDTSHIKVIFEFFPATHFLVHAKDDRFANAKDGDNDPLMAWTLNCRIDRSEKGKIDDIGMPEIYISDEEAEQCKKAGFTAIEYADK